MLNGFDNGILEWRGVSGPAIQFLVADGYDRSRYISTSQLVPYPYITQAQIEARFPGNFDLIPSTDDSGTGDVNEVILNQIIANVTAEINSYISTIYPIPLSRIGTEAILMVTAVDSNGVVTAIEVVEPGNYQSAPFPSTSGQYLPVYLRQENPFEQARINANPSNYPSFRGHQGIGLQLNAQFIGSNSQIMVGGSLQYPSVLNGTPTIVNGGTKYQVNEFLVFTGGSSYLPDVVINSAITLVCFELQRRRLNPQEFNLYAKDAERFKDQLQAIGHGEMELDGNFRRFFSPGGAWVSESVIGKANSL